MKKPSAQEALVCLMVIVSASDREMGDPELARIGALARTLPALRGFNAARTLVLVQECQQWMAQDDGLPRLLAAIHDALTPELRDTAYAISVDVAMADLDVELGELRILQILREALDLDRATVNTIHEAAKIRHRPLD